VLKEKKTWRGGNNNERKRERRRWDDMEKDRSGPENRESVGTLVYIGEKLGVC